MLNENRKRIVLPCLDREFQKISKVDKVLINEYCRAVLFLVPRIVVSPSFFFESELTFNSILLDRAFQKSPYIQMSMKESRIDDFVTRKQRSYIDLKNYYPEFFLEPEKVMSMLNLDVTERKSKIADLIKTDWQESINENGSMSISNALRTKDKSYDKDFLDALKYVPVDIGDNPFVWENVEKSLDGNFKDWRGDKNEYVLSCYLLKYYFDSLCAKSSSLLSFNDFNINIFQYDCFHSDTVSIRPFINFITAAGIKEIYEMPGDKIIKSIESIECIEFRHRYFEVVGAFDDFTDKCEALQNERRNEYRFPKRVAYEHSIRKKLDKLFSIFGAKVSRFNSVKDKLSFTPIDDFITYIKKGSTGKESLDEIEKIMEEILKNKYEGGGIQVAKKIINNSMVNNGVQGVAAVGAKNIKNNDIKIDSKLKSDLKAVIEELERTNSEMLKEVKKIRKYIKNNSENEIKKVNNSTWKKLYDVAEKLGLKALKAYIKAKLGLVD